MKDSKINDNNIKNSKTNNKNNMKNSKINSNNSNIVSNENYILSTYTIKKEDLEDPIQILNCDENEGEIKDSCELYMY